MKYETLIFLNNLIFSNTRKSLKSNVYFVQEMQLIWPLTLKSTISTKSITTEWSQNKKTKCSFFQNEVSTWQDRKMKLCFLKTQHIILEKWLVQYFSVYIFAALKFTTIHWLLISSKDILSLTVYCILSVVWFYLIQSYK